MNNKNNPKKSNNVMTQFAKDTVTVIMGTFISYFLVQIINLSILEKKAHISFDDKLLFHLFSYQMIPAIISFLILIAAVYYLYKKAKKTIEQLNQNELQQERAKAVINTSQKLTSIMISYIEKYNGEIKAWIESRIKKGQQPPNKIFNANKKISMALLAMSELSYVTPYINKADIDWKTYENRLEDRLQQISANAIPVIGSA